jgi:hypothetical protein
MLLGFTCYGGRLVTRLFLDALAKNQVKRLDGFHIRVLDMSVSDVLDSSVGNVRRGGYLDPLTFKGMQPSQDTAQGLTV